MLIALRGFSYDGVAYEATAEPSLEADAVDGPSAGGMDSVALVEPASVYTRVVPAERPPRESYSDSSISAELHDEEEDPSDPAGALAAEAADGVAASDEADGSCDERDERGPRRGTVLQPGHGRTR